MSSLLSVFSFLSLTGCGKNVNLQEQIESMSFAPDVPPPITRTYSDTVRVYLNASMKDIALAQNVMYHAWTFNDHVPGPFLRTRVGDVLEVHVSNSDNTGMLHNIDFHAVTGPGGGSLLTSVAPGQTRVAYFKMMHPGLFIYHCATHPMTAHISNGMYGVILVQPKDGLPKVDHEYYVMQSEFYTTAPVKDSLFVQYSPEDGMREDPRFVVFNGSTDALLGNGALRAKTGETVRIYFGNIGPNKISSFHIVGCIMDKVYREGDLVSEPARSVQTTLVPAGGAAVVEVQPIVPGAYILVDHSMFRTEKGAMGILNVHGEPRPDVYSGQ
ncbi:MAG: nitrite reductase, copper-containing [Bacteroidota bacterium]|nr:nitrite reductase, copper-containing [Bacteroidota bacterium]